MSITTQPKELTIANLSKIHAKSNNFMRTIMCRAEFANYVINHDARMFKFKNDINLHKQIRFIIKAKENMKGNTCRSC